MTGEMDLYGIFLPDLLIWMLVAFAISVALRRVLDWCGAYRLIWHRPLFDLALYVVLVGGTLTLAARFLA
jgi:hypothetical protein